MGTVFRQSFLTSGLSYLGVIIGYLNILYLYPRFLDVEQMGLHRLITDIGLLLTPFAQAGLMQGTVKYFSSFNQNRQSMQEFATFTLLASLASFTLFAVAFWIFKDPVANLFTDESLQLRPYMPTVLVFILILVFTALAEAYYRVNLNVVFVNFIKDLLIRLLNAVAVMLYFWGLISFDGLIYSIAIIYGIATLVLYIGLFFKYELRFNSFPSISRRSLYKEVIKYSLFMIIGSGGILIVGKLDSIMIGAYLGLAETGIYTVAYFIATVIEIPKRAMAQIITPLYAQAFQQKELLKVKELYRKSAITQLIVAQLLLIGLLINLHNLYVYVPKGDIFEAGKWVVVLVGFSRLVDSAAGMNGELIVMSKYYKFNIWAIGALSVLTAASNLLLIPILGMNGAALATLITFLFFNLIKGGFIYQKYQVQPFSINTLKTLATGGICFLAGFYLPKVEPTWLDIIYRSAIVSLLYFGLTLSLTLSEDINKLSRQAWLQLKNYF
jgi:O-antigen/teichoic acid export membrane protein